MSYPHKLDPSSTSFIPDPQNQPDTVSGYMNVFGTDFSATFPELGLNFDPYSSEECSRKQDKSQIPHPPQTAQTHHGHPMFQPPGVTLEKVQMEMCVAFDSFMQLQHEYQAKLQRVER
jgi:hypothetical protein